MKNKTEQIDIKDKKDKTEQKLKIQTEQKLNIQTKQKLKIQIEQILKITLSFPYEEALRENTKETQLLLSRSGVLIEFKSGVFTGYRRAIQGLNSTFHQNDIWMISG